MDDFLTSEAIAISPDLMAKRIEVINELRNSDNKKIKLDILFKTGKSINTYSDNLGKKFHLLDSITTNNSC